MNRIPVNPWPWSLNLGYNQGEVLSKINRHLICAGQTSVDQEGNPLHPDDMAKQVSLALDNLEEILKAADMNIANIISLRIYTTDVEKLFKHFNLLASRFAPFKAAPPMTLVGVNQLAIPSLMFEIEATAAD